MTAPEQQEIGKFDPRAYVAIFVFRWKIILLCFLYCLLGGVLYIQFAPRQYLSEFTVMLWRDPALAVSNRGEEWASMRTHIWLLTGEELRTRTIDRLKKDWREKLGGMVKMRLDVNASPVRGDRSMMNVSVRNPDREYARAYLVALWEEFQAKQALIKKETTGSASKMLDEELGLLEERIGEAEDDVVNYARLNQLDFTTAKGSMEYDYLMALLSYQNQLTTELMLLEAQFPMLKEEDATVIQDAGNLTREAGAVTPIREVEGAGIGEKEKDKILAGASVGRIATDEPEVKQWQGMKARLMQLELREKELTEKFKPEHPEVREVQIEMANLRNHLKIGAQVAFGRLTARRKALKIAYDSMEVPIRTWKNTYRQASQKRAGYRRRTMVVDRREAMYRTLYDRLHDLKISEELKADHLIMMEQIKSGEAPVYPNPAKIMLVAIVLALGSGLGLASLAHMFDNKMQTIADVEKELRIPFLGGIPHWVRRGKDRVVRPIVLDEHSSGAIEAYRVLRTSVLAALDRAGQKIAMFTSAESREGKTITVLNLAVVTGQVGKKVLLIDMDLRRPRLHRSFGLDRSPGVTDALRDGSRLRDLAQATSLPNVWFIPGGADCHHAAELLQSADLVAFLADVRAEYDYVFMDSSPVLRTTDASILSSPQVCSVIYVAHVNQTPKPLVRYSLDLLGNAHVLGLVMNNIEMNRISSLYYSYQYPNYAYYAYAYAYGYEYDAYYGGDQTGKSRRKRRSVSDFTRTLRHRLRRALLPLE